MLGLFSFSARSGRLAYLGAVAVQIGLVFLMIVAGAAAATSVMRSGAGPSSLGGVALFGFLGLLLLMWLGFSSMARRIRDIGWPVVWTIVIMYVASTGAAIVDFGSLDYSAGLQSVLADLQTPRLRLSSVVSWVEAGILLLWPGRARGPDITVFDDPTPATDEDPVARYMRTVGQATRRPEPVETPEPQPVAREAYSPPAAPTFGRRRYAPAGSTIA